MCTLQMIYQDRK